MSDKFVCDDDPTVGAELFEPEPRRKTVSAAQKIAERMMAEAST